jgi:hypothetical protein
MFCKPVSHWKLYLMIFNEIQKELTRLILKEIIEKKKYGDSTTCNAMK